MEYFYDFILNPYMLAFLGSLLAFILAYRMNPVIIHTVRLKNLMDEPGVRSAHSAKTPTLGGIGLFAAFSLTLMLLGIVVGLERPELLKLLSIMAATMILMFMGIKDDLIDLAPKKKFLGQLVASGIVIFLTDVRITSLEGLLGVGELPYLVSVIFTVFVFILVINAFNLIDGIDGLAGTICIIASLSFGIFFLLNNHYLLALISFSLIGATIGFLIFNLSDSNKLFMGDSGSMFIGYLLAYQGISFLSLNADITSVYIFPNAPILLLATLSFPLLDTLRVFVIRVGERRSPFSADNNHIHHRLLKRGLSHKQTTIILAIINILVIELAILVKDLEINIQLVSVALLGSILYTLLFNFNRLREKVIKLNNVKAGKDRLRIAYMDIKKYVPSLGSRHSFIEEPQGTKRATVNSVNTMENMELSERQIKELEKSKKLILGTKKWKRNNKIVITK